MAHRTHRSMNPEHLLGIGVSVLALWCTWVAVPVLTQSLSAEPSRGLIEEMRRENYDLTTADLEAAYITDSAARLLTGDHLINQGIAALALADGAAPFSARQQEYLDSAIALSRQRLARAPHDVHAWTRLAYGLNMRDGQTRDTLDALRQSYNAGQWEYYVLWPRIRLGAAMWPQLDDALKELTLSQIGMAVRADGGPHELARVYLAVSPEFQAEIIAAMSDNSARSEFERFVRLEQERLGQTPAAR